MSWPVDEGLKSEANREVVEYLMRASPSAHSDVASELEQACAAVEGVRTWCPDAAHYAYVLAVDSRDHIIGLAAGMGDVVFRVGRDQRSAALSEGGREYPGLGEDWVCFDPFPVDESLEALRKRLGTWCAIASRASTG
jgi:hypothetical protein